MKFKNHIIIVLMLSLMMPIGIAQDNSNNSQSVSREEFDKLRKEFDELKKEFNLVILRIRGLKRKVKVLQAKK